jgi:hypothetical protein
MTTPQTRSLFLSVTHPPDRFVSLVTAALPESDLVPLESEPETKRKIRITKSEYFAQ